MVLKAISEFEMLQCYKKMLQKKKNVTVLNVNY